MQIKLVILTIFASLVAVGFAAPSLQVPPSLEADGAFGVLDSAHETAADVVEGAVQIVAAPFQLVPKILHGPTDQL
ncbi:hypothetical protein G6F71_005521 [Rhizopus microsporus]|nr:hypothetical protein G6F71_005521 [Rhizopus microsporus]KAG1210177.1 hypothetical protein G6F69_005721 [Rhizopus microsporus]KAG1232158.1 hypothetical protein G6F67_005233 [Rhizopus microsporus]